MLLARFPRGFLVGRPHVNASMFHSSSARWARKVQHFKLADIGEGITECEVISWSVKPQGTVQAFDLLCEVQSDKASVEITSPFDGVVKELLVQEGEVARVGEGLCLIEVEDEESELALPVQPVIAPPPDSKESIKSPESKSINTSPPPRPHPLDPNNPPDAAKILGDSLQNALAVPSVRHFARQSGIFDLSKLMPGSGKKGRIEKIDIEAYLAGPSSAAVQGSATSNIQEDTVVELGRTRYGMWKAMVKSLEIPHFGYSTTLDLTTLQELLPVLNAHVPEQYRPSSQPQLSEAVSSSSILPPPSPPSVPPSGQFTRLTYLPILLKTLSRAMMEWPLLRASITPTCIETPHKPTLTVRPQADISIALATSTGLYTPTIQGVNAHSVYSLASRLKHLSHLGRQTPCGLTPNEMPKRGGTLTVSNIGSIGRGDFASPVLVPGGGIAIVAIGRAKWVWDVNQRAEGERRLKVGVSWSADHRVVEGAELAAFVECWRGWVENPQRLIADGI